MTERRPPTFTGSALDVYRPEDDGTLVVSLHPSQAEVFSSEARFVAAIAGAQSGKTVVGPPWLHQEMVNKGPGDYMVAGPTYRLLSRKVIPTFRLYFEDLLGLGTYHVGSAEFVLSREGEVALWGEEQPNPTTVFFSHAQSSDSLESATLKGCWLDECGQKQFKLDSWQAIQRRLSVFKARALLTTTPYNLGWLKQMVYDRALAGDPDYQVVNFPSTANPAFDPAEDARLRRDLPAWKYEMFHQGRFTRPAGLIFDAHSTLPYPEGHVHQRFPIPPSWPRHVGLDFGGVNTAAVFLAAEPNSRRLWLYREYLRGGLTAAGHARELRRGEPSGAALASVTGGAKSEGQWRQEFRAAGLDVRRPPISDVEVGIDRVYGCHARGEIIAFDDCTMYLDQVATYARELDDTGQPTEKIEDKETYHVLDALRYTIAHLRRSTSPPRRGIRVVR